MEQKLCTDCKYHESAFGYNKCGYYRSSIDGGAAAFCLYERAYDGRCGPDAKHFDENTGNVAMICAGIMIVSMVGLTVLTISTTGA